MRDEKCDEIRLCSNKRERKERFIFIFKCSIHIKLSIDLYRCLAGFSINKCIQNNYPTECGHNGAHFF